MRALSETGAIAQAQTSSVGERCLKAPRPRRDRLSTRRAGHACADPGLQRFHELLVRERWSRAAGAGAPGPEDEWIHLHVLDDLLPGGTSGTAVWARHGRPFRGRPAVDEGWRRPFALETRPDGSSCISDA